MSEHSAVEDPCGEFGPVQRWAGVWFVAVICIAVGLAYTFAHTDSFMYKTGAENFDYNTYRENRLSQTSLKSDTVDERSEGDYSTAAQRAAQ